MRSGEMPLPSEARVSLKAALEATVVCCSRCADGSCPSPGRGEGPPLWGRRRVNSRQDGPSLHPHRLIAELVAATALRELGSLSALALYRSAPAPVNLSLPLIK